MMGLGRKVVAGAAWMVALRFSTRAIGLLSTVILARLLVPGDFGLVLLATAVIGLLELFSDFGVEMVLIRQRGRDRTLYDTAWTINVLRGCVFFLVLVAGAPSFSLFFGDSRLELIFYVLACTCLVNGLTNIGVVEFRKELNFQREFVLRLCRSATAFAATLCAAIVLRNYWALICGIVIGEVVGVLLSYLMHPYRPNFSLRRIADVMSFSIWLLFTSVLGALTLRAPVFFLGRLGTPVDVGIYSVAKEVAELPTTELVWPIAAALYPGYAKISHDQMALRRVYQESCAAVFMLGAPLGVGLALVAPWVVALFLGEKWLDVVPLMEIIAIAGVLRILTSGASAMYLTLGKVRAYFSATFVAALVTVPALYWLISMGGQMGAAYAYLWGACASTALHLVVVTRLLQVPLATFFWRIRRSIVALIVMMACVGLLKDILDPAGTLLDVGAQLLLISAVGAAAYTSVHYLLWRVEGSPEAAEAQLLRLLVSTLERAKTDLKPGSS